MVPVHVAMHRVNRTQYPGTGRFANVAEMRRPAGVLVHGETDLIAVGQFDEPLALVEVEHKRLLAQHMLAGGESRFDERRALRRMIRLTGIT